MQFTWREGSRYGGEAQPVGERLEWLRKRHGDSLKPDDVVADARDTSSPLHSCFTWDDSQAAENYRRWEARRLMGAVLVVYDEPGMPTEPSRAFICVDPGGAPTYMRQRDVAASEEFSPLAARDIVLAFKSVLRRARDIVALAAVADHAEAGIAMVQALERAWRQRPRAPEPEPVPPPTRRRRGRA